MLHPETRICPQFNSCTVIHFSLRPTLYRDTAPVPAISIVTGDIPIAIGIAAPLKFVPRSGSNSQTLQYKCKTYAILSLHRDSFTAKVPGPDSYRDCPDATSSNATFLYCRPLPLIRDLLQMIRYFKILIIYHIICKDYLIPFTKEYYLCIQNRIFLTQEE
jgi:hypothetical protein